MATSRSMTSMASTSQSLLIKSQCSNAHSNPNPNLMFTNKISKKTKKHIQQLLPIVRGGKPQREGVTNSRDKIRSAQRV